MNEVMAVTRRLIGGVMNTGTIVPVIENSILRRERELSETDNLKEILRPTSGLPLLLWRSPTAADSTDEEIEGR